MCSIHGFNFKNEPAMREMVKATRHRGPDDAGIEFFPECTLGNNRLSIIDLSTAGHQPMKTPDGRFTIVFNGEIYNFADIRKELIARGYSFRSKTDTEVVLYAYKEWGKECLKKLNGMFGLAVYDARQRELFLARDRIGIKPLYYYHRDGKFIFSSEVKAIFKTGVTSSLNVDALNMYFRILYVPSPFTIWNDVYKVRPGHFVTVKEGIVREERYWDYPDAPLLSDALPIQKEIRLLLIDSVRLQLISDRPVGVFLSGGIDSTIIAALVADATKHVKTFTVGFESTEEAEKYNNDAQVAKRTAKHLGAEHHECILRARDVIDALPESVYHMDEPISNHVQAVNMLLAKYTAPKVTVVLEGSGGDELFGGYERYYYNAVIDRIQGAGMPLCKALALLARVADRKEFARKLSLAPGAERYLEFFAQKEARIGSFLRPEYNKATVTKDVFEALFFKEALPRGPFTREFMRTDVRSWLPDESLLRSDKMAMAASLEGRVPFLDHRLVEFADRIPVAMKLGTKGLAFGDVGHGYRGKKILTEAMEKYIPDDVLKQQKWGWFSPASKWLRTDLRPLLEEVLRPSWHERSKDILDFEALRTLYQDHIDKKTYALNTLWSVLTFQLWLREFGKTL
jgi:asparagine synthase (glutamine-hydrolysing)